MKLCKFCESPFEPKRPHARYCSDRCRTTAWKAARVNGPQVPGERVLAAPVTRVVLPGWWRWALGVAAAVMCAVVLWWALAKREVRS